MAEAKTKITDVSVDAFLEAVEPATKRDEGKLLDALFRKVTGAEPKMWGPSIIGYGSYDYTYASGHSGTSLRAGFSPRKAKHSLYLHGALVTEADRERRTALLERLGKHSEAKACVYVNKLAEIDMAVLEELVRHSWDCMARAYPE
jgi:hypothetical protein